MSVFVGDFGLLENRAVFELRARSNEATRFAALQQTRTQSYVYAYVCMSCHSVMCKCMYNDTNVCMYVYVYVYV